MTAAALQPSIEYIENGISTAFSVPFRFLPGTLEVKRIDAAGSVTILNAGVEFSASGGTTDGGGTVNVVTPAIAGTVLRIRRITPRNQPMDYTTGDTFPAESHELALDRAMLIDQEQDVSIADIYRRAITVGEGEAAPVLPSAAARANQLFGFGPLGQIVLYVTSSIVTLASVINYVGDYVGSVSRTVKARLDDSVSVKDFGAIGNGIADDSVAVQLAYDRVAAAGGGDLFFPRGTYRIALNMTSRNVHIRGAGRGVTILKPATATGVALRPIFREGSWNGVSMRDFAIEGAGTLQGVGIKCGADVYTVLDEFSGIIYAERIRFANLDKCVQRLGSIGFWTRSCQFEAANFHIHSTGTINGTPVGATGMHAGCLFVDKAHLQGAQKSVFYFDSPMSDSGQILVSNSIAEGNPGFIWYFRKWLSAGGVPSPYIRDFWQEVNYTATNVTVEGRLHATTKYLFAKDCDAAIQFENTPVGPIELESARVSIQNSSLDNLSSIVADRTSAVMIDKPWRFTNGTVPVAVARQIAPPSGLTGLGIPWTRLGLPRGQTRAFDANIVSAFQASSIETWNGSAGARATVKHVAAAMLPGRVAGQKFTINSGETMLPPGFTVPAGKVMVFDYGYALVSGPAVTMNITGGGGIGGTASLSSSKPERLVLLVDNSGGALAGDSFYHYGAGATSEIAIGFRYVLSFDTLQEALHYINSGLVPGSAGAAIADVAAAAAAPTQAEFNALVAAFNTLLAQRRTQGNQEI